MIITVIILQKARKVKSFRENAIDAMITEILTEK